MTTETKLKGTYCLLIHLTHDSKITVGKLGEIDFKKGYYVYVGSALNSLEGRIKRHLRDDKKLFWHIDYLLARENAEIVDVVFTIGDIKWECDLASQIAENGTKIDDFGCSDCKCNSHLFFFKNFLNSKDSCKHALKWLNLKYKTLEDLIKIKIETF